MFSISVRRCMHRAIRGGVSHRIRKQKFIYRCVATRRQSFASRARIGRGFYIPMVDKCRYKNRYCSTKSGPEISKGDRLLNLINIFADKPAGMIFETYQFCWLFKDYVDAPNSAEKTEINDETTKLRAYIVGKDGLSQIEKDSFIQECINWNSSLSVQEFEHLADIGSNFNEEELQKCCDAINKIPLIYRKGVIFNALINAAVDGLSEIELEAFKDVAKRLNIDDKTIQNMHSLYLLECQLKQKYNETFLSN
eukprot:439475_1